MRPSCLRKRGCVGGMGAVVELGTEMCSKSEDCYHLEFRTNSMSVDCFPGTNPSSNGIESQLASNRLGRFLLTNLGMVIGFCRCSPVVLVLDVRQLVSLCFGVMYCIRSGSLQDRNESSCHMLSPSYAHVILRTNSFIP